MCIIARGSNTYMDVEFRLMITIIGHFKDHTVCRKFDCLFDAIDYRDNLDAQYARVEWLQTCQ